MDIKVTEEDLKVSRGFAEALNQEPEEVDSTLCAEKFHDVLTHRDNWRECIVFRRDAVKMTGNDLDPGMRDHGWNERSYWQHELEAFDRTFDLLEKAMK